MKNKFYIILAIISCFISINSNAQTKDFYDFKSDIKNKIYIEPKASYGWAKYKDGDYELKGRGLAGVVAFGYLPYDNIRTEVEFLFDDGIKINKTIIEVLNNKNTETFTRKIQMKSYGALINAYYDFKNYTRITPYITVGIGWSYNMLKLSHQLYNNNYLDNEGWIKSKRNSIAWQIGTGIGIGITENLDFNIGYRMLDRRYNKIKIIGSLKNPTQTSISSTPRVDHMILIGTRIKF